YRLRHGEAVAVGMALDVTYARIRGFLPASAAERILSLLERLGFELFAPELLHEDDTGQFRVVNGLEEFREHLGGELTVTLVRNVGEGFEVHEMELPVVIRAMGELRERHLNRGGAILRAQA
ncbi:MAG TPA: 3-dehydroquinate synthase, partial [Verrucomicrobiales bacterium]|nr:3-dehydroquinate synthase [Verrucomicrobiales bacterium]